MTVTVTHTKVATLPDQPGVEINKAEWNDTHAIAGLAAVASSGAYADLSGLPTLGALAALNAASLTANVTGILPWANGGTNNNATPGAGQLIYSDASKYVADGNLTWSSTTGLLTKKGISSKGATNGAGTELFGLGASDACTLATTNNTISGAGAAQNGNNGFETNNSIYGQGSTISSAASSCLFGQGISLTALFSLNHTLIGQGISVASGNAVTITGAANSANQQTVINGSANSVSASGIHVGVFGTSNSYTNKYGGLFGSNMSSYRDNELGIGYVDGIGATAIPFSLSFSGTTGAFVGRQILRIGSAWIDATDATRKARALFYVNDTAEREYMRADSNGTGVNLMVPNLKVGDTTAASAILQLIAGTATASTAPIKFSLPGVPLTTPELGVLETSAEKLLYTKTSLIREALIGCIFTQTADKTVTNTVTETSIVGTGVGYGLTLPANFWIAGKQIAFDIGGIYSTPALATPSATLKIKLGSVVIATVTTSSLLSGASALQFAGKMTITCRTTGGTGTVICDGDIRYSTGVAGTSATDPLNNGGATTTIDTTASALLDITLTWDSATTTRIATSTTSSARVLN